MSKSALKIGVYPGTFDPITKGHLHLIRRASKLVDRLIVGVAASPRKGPLFSLEDRTEMVREDIANLPNKRCAIEVKPFSDLLTEFASRENATFIIRGLRAVSDFEYEFQLAGMNAKLDADLEMIYLMASEKWQFVAASFVKEIASLGGNVEDFVTPQVAQRLRFLCK